jgi:hypothetical protein
MDNGENHFYVCLCWGKNLKIVSKTSRPISIKLDANFPCMKVIQVCLDKGKDLHQRGDNHKYANIGWGHLKILFSRTNDLGKLGLTCI